jgi:hypothetical protein
MTKWLTMMAWEGLTFHYDFKCTAVTLVFGGDLTTVATCVSFHYFDDAHLICVDLVEMAREEDIHPYNIYMHTHKRVTQMYSRLSLVQI